MRRMTRQKGKCKGKGKGKMRGSLHFAVDGEAVHRFGRDDGAFSRGLASETISRGLKPGLWATLHAKAEALAYLRGKSEKRIPAG